MKILIFSRDHVLIATLRAGLEAYDCVVDVTRSVEDAGDMLRAFAYDIAISDHPAVKAIETLRRRVATPIIALTRNGVAEIAASLNAGADDAMTHPIDIRELHARCLAVVRRWRGHAENIVTIGDLTINLDTGASNIGGHNLALTNLEFRMMEIMALRTPRPIAQETWMDLLYSNSKAPDSRVVDVMICKLRRKMFKVSGGRDYIQNLWGRGHCLISPGKFVVQRSKASPTYRSVA